MFSIPALSEWGPVHYTMAAYVVQGNLRYGKSLSTTLVSRHLHHNFEHALDLLVAVPEEEQGQEGVRADR